MPTSTAAVSPPVVSNRTYTSASGGEGSESDTLQAEPLHTDARVLVRASGDRGDTSEMQGCDERRSDEKSGKEKSGKENSSVSPPGAEPTGTLKVRAPHKQLQRQGHLLNLKEKQLHLRFDKLLQEGGGDFDVEVRTAEMLEALISWLKAGHPVKIFRLACDFGGLHQGGGESDDDSDDSAIHQKPATFDEQMFERLLDACHGIETVDLTDCKLSSGNYRTLRRFLMRKDCHVDCLLFGGQIIFDIDVARLARGLERNASLTQLSLCDTSMATDNLARIIDAVILNPRIRSLWIENVDACFGALPALGKLVDAGHCVHLSLSSPNGVKMVGRDVKFWNALFKDFCRRLAANSSLRLLDLSGFELTNSNFRALIHALKSNMHLEWLELGINAPSKEQIELIKSCLQRNRTGNRKRLMPHAREALDLLAGAVVPDSWPRELSDLITAWMTNDTLEQMKRGIEAGFPKSKRSRKLKAAAASASPASSVSAAMFRQRPRVATASPVTTAAAAQHGIMNTTDAPAPLASDREEESQ